MMRLRKLHYLFISFGIVFAIAGASALVLWFAMRPVVAPSKSASLTPVNLKTEDAHRVTFAAMGEAAKLPITS